MSPSLSRENAPFARLCHNEELNFYGTWVSLHMAATMRNSPSVKLHYTSFCSWLHNILPPTQALCMCLTCEDFLVSLLLICGLHSICL